MKKLLLVLALFSFVLCGCASSQDENTITIALSDDLKPFEYRNEELDLMGFDVEFIEALAQKLQKDYKIETIDWEVIFDQLDEGKYDLVISGVSKTPDREQAYSLSEPYVSNGVVLVSLAGKENPATEFSEVVNERVGVIDGTSSDDLAEYVHETEGKNSTIVKYEDSDQLYNALKNGDVDYVLSDVGVYAFYQKNDPSYKVTSKDVLTNEPLVVVAKSDNKALIEDVNAAIEEMRADGTLKALSEKYFGADYTTDIDTQVQGIPD